MEMSVMGSEGKEHEMDRDDDVDEGSDVPSQFETKERIEQRFVIVLESRSSQ
jgi:hypothetical protein